MIVTVIGAAGAARPELPSLLAANLAQLRRDCRRRVRLLDATAPGEGVLGARIEIDASRCQDLVIDGGTCDSRGWRPALIAARVALVPLMPADADLDGHYRLAACLNAARMFNPGLRVLLVAAGDGGVDAAGLAAVRRYGDEVMAAHVAATVLDARAPGLAQAHADLIALAAEVYGAPPHAASVTTRPARLALQ